MRAILAYHFEIVTETRFSKAPRLITEEVSFTEIEVMLALQGRRDGKASGLDRLPIEVLKLMHPADPDVLTAVMDRCLDLRPFTKAWKNARVVQS